MKLILATPLYPPDSGGPATDAALLNTELPAYGIETAVCSFGEVRHLPSGIRHLQYGYNLFKCALGTHGKSAANGKSVADAIVAFDTFSVCIPAAIVAKLLDKPLIIRVPGDFAWEQATQRYGVTDSIETFQKKRYGARVELMRSMQKFAARSAALLVVPSDFFRSIVLQWGIVPERVVRIYLGINLQEEATMPTDPLVKTPTGKILFSVGRFVPWKGFSMLIDLMKELPNEWHLVIAGDGPQRVQLEAQSTEIERKQQLGNFGTSNSGTSSKRVTFTGAIPRTEVLGWLRQADAFVLNTSFESFSFQVVEAMASGTPVITTPVGSIPELITNEVEGVLCTPNDSEAFKEAILSTQSDTDSWKKRTEAAKLKAQNFSTKASLDAFVEALKKVVPNI